MSTHLLIISGFLVTVPILIFYIFAIQFIGAHTIFNINHFIYTKAKKVEKAVLS